jgi:hypothetical protein
MHDNFGRPAGGLDPIGRAIGFPAGGDRKATPDSRRFDRTEIVLPGFFDLKLSGRRRPCK